MAATYHLPAGSTVQITGPAKLEVVWGSDEASAASIKPEEPPPELLSGESRLVAEKSSSS